MVIEKQFGRGTVMRLGDKQAMKEMQVFLRRLERSPPG